MEKILMKGKTHSTGEMIRILRQADGGETAQSVCRAHNISEQTYYRRRKEYGGMEVAQVHRLKELEQENSRLKRLVADQALDNLILKEAARGNF
jgi:transposase-like protein